jgi:uridine phosphorylase
MLPAKISKITRWVLLLSIISAADAQEKAAQPTNSQPQRVEFKPGQVWRTVLGATVTILAVEELRKVGKVVHIRVDNIPVGSCGGVHLSTTIPHIALTEKMMQKGAYALEKDYVDLPDSYLDEYRKWETKKKHEVLKELLKTEIEMASLSGSGIMICNFLPSQG